MSDRDDDRGIDEQFDRDRDREGAYGSYLPYRRRPGTARTLIQKAAGVLQQRIPERITTTHDIGEQRCACSLCRRADPSRKSQDEDAPKVVREMPLDGAFEIGGEG